MMGSVKVRGLGVRGESRAACKPQKSQNPLRAEWQLPLGILTDQLHLWGKWYKIYHRPSPCATMEVTLTPGPPLCCEAESTFLLLSPFCFYLFFFFSPLNARQEMS